MASENDQAQGNPQKKMYEGDWSCSMCGQKITKLPFEPKEDRMNTLKCMDCWKKSRQPR